MSASDVPLTDTLDVSDDDFSDEDVDSDYESCESYVSDGTAEDAGDGELQILQWNYDNDKWEPVEASDVKDLVGPSLTSSTGWVSQSDRFYDAAINSRERCMDAIAVLSETVGGVAKQLWHGILSYEERDGRTCNYFWNLQVLLFLIMSSKSTDTVWWQFYDLYIPSQRMYQYSFSSNLFEGRMVVDHSPDRLSKDLAEAMQILLPYFREMKARLDTLSSNVGYSSDSTSILGPSNLANLTTGLDIAESVAKLVPVFGQVIEGACGILRKTVEAAEKARAARDECRALAEHTTSITLAILQEIGPASTLSGADINRICDLRQTLDTVNDRVQRFSKLGRMKYLFYRGRINTEVMELRAKVDNARTVFNIRNDISTAQLLTDLKNMQIRLASRVEDIYQGQKHIYEGQKTTHHMLRTLLVEVKGTRSGGAYIDQAD